MMHLKRIALPAGFAALAISQAAAQPAAPVPVARNGEKPRNVIFILSDDHRYDFMGFTGAVPWLQTPALDRMAREGACLKNAFVTTSLSSPSRASILTGLFTHTHTVVDNQAPKPDDLVFSRSTSSRTDTAPPSSANGTWAIRTTCPSPDSTIGRDSADRGPTTTRCSTSTASA